MKRIILLLLGSGILLGGLVVGLPLFTIFNQQADGSPQPGPTTQVVATVNGEAITRDMLEAEVNISRLNVQEPRSPLTGEDLVRAEEEALNQLISRHIILQAAARENFKLDDVFIQERVDLLFGSYGDEALDKALRQARVTREDLFWWVSEMTTAEEYVIQVIMAGVDPDARRQVYNDWLNTQQATADIQIFSDGATESFAAVIGKPASDFTLTSLDGRPVSLSDYKGKVVLVNFWATWCPSCATAMPEHQQIYQRYGRPAGDGQPAGDFVILGVNLQEDPDWVEEFVDSLGITFPILLDRDGRITSRQYQVSAMPTSFIIDRQGIIYYRHAGPMSGDFLTAKLAELGF